MAIPWTTIESALGDGRAVPEVIAPLIRSCASEIETMFRRIGARDAGRLLMQAQSAHAAERRAKLTACLADLDDAVPEIGQLVKVAPARLWHRRRDQASRYLDVAQSALLAALIDIELGGDSEALRTRFASAATALECHIAAVPRDPADQEAETRIRQARGVFVRVSRFMRTDDD